MGVRDEDEQEAPRKIIRRQERGHVDSPWSRARLRLVFPCSASSAELRLFTTYISTPFEVHSKAMEPFNSAKEAGAMCVPELFPRLTANLTRLMPKSSSDRSRS